MSIEAIGGGEQFSEDDPRSALAAFYRAFNARDLETMEQLWLGGDEPSMSNPLGGIACGWNEIAALYRRLFEGEARVRVEFDDFQIAGIGNGFVGRERGTFDRCGETFDLAIRTSRLFRWEPGSWRQLHHHGSMDDPSLLERYQQAARDEKMTKTLKAQSHLPFEDRVDIEDALYRFAAGQDLKDRALLESAFAGDAVLDFVHPASRLGTALEPFRGRDAIAGAVWGATAGLTTSHTITNVRIIEREGDVARVTALVEAQHLPLDDDSRNLLLKNALDVELFREHGRWLIVRMDFRNLWKEGDPRVLFP